MSRAGTVVAIALSLIHSSACKSQEGTRTPLHGTVNVILVNPNYTVMVTDSMLSNAKEEPVGYGRKLFKIDDSTFVSIAGQFSDFGPALGSADNHPVAQAVPAIIEDYVEHVKYPPDYPMINKLRAIAGIVAFGLDLVANIDQVSHAEYSKAQSIVTIAGRENGVNKVMQEILTPVVKDGFTSMAVSDGCSQNGSEGLNYCVAGYYDVAEQLLSSPETVSPDPIVNRWIKAKALNRGASLDRVDLYELATDAAQRTACKYSNVVGGVLQAAIVGKDGPGWYFDPIPVENVYSKLRFNRVNGGMIDNTSGAPWAGGISTDSTAGSFVIGMTMKGIKRQDLDRVLFVNSTFEDCDFIYDGPSVVLFDKSNKLIGTTHLKLGPHVRENNWFVKKIKADFPQIKIVRDDASLPVKPLPKPSHGNHG